MYSFYFINSFSFPQTKFNEINTAAMRSNTEEENENTQSIYFLSGFFRNTIV